MNPIEECWYGIKHFVYQRAIPITHEAALIDAIDRYWKTKVTPEFSQNFIANFMASEIYPNILAAIVNIVDG